MSDSKVYLIFVVVLFVLIFLFSSASTIFPFMGDDKYFVDKYGTIHGKHCHYKEVPWFTIKHSKYDIILLKEQDICRECLLFEEDKLKMLHDYNLSQEIKRLKRVGASDEYITNRIDKYKQ